MKIAKLLVVSALWLTAGSAVAAVEDIRQKPEPSATQGFVASETTDTYFYMYNVGAKAFFTEGNAWGTQASVASTGLKVAFTSEGNYYLFNDYSISKASWKYTFFDSETAMYVDWNSQANYYWGVEENGSTFRLYASSENPGWDEVEAYREGQYVGLDASTGGTALSPYLTEGDGHYIDWAFVTEEVYETYKAAAEVYDAAQSLKAVLEEAESINANVADQLAVYNNLEATAEELTAAVEAAKEAIAQRKAEMVDENYGNATVENPVVVTDKFLVNPSFDGGDLTTGWEGDAFGSYNPKDNAEHYNKTYNTYQTVSGLKGGVYGIGVKAFYRAGNAQPAWDNYAADNAASKYAKLYATVGEITSEVAIVSPCTAMLTEGAGVGSESTCESEDGTVYYIPNNMEAAEYYMHTLKMYDNMVMTAVDEDGSLTFGVKKEQTIDGDWSIFDDFSLTYYGAGADAYKLYLDEVLKNYSDVTIEEGTLYTESYLTDYRNSLSNATSASSKEEIDAILEGITGGYDRLMKNIELWKKWNDALEEAKRTYVYDESYAGVAMDDLSDYCDSEAEDIKSARALTNDELEAEIQKIAVMVQAVIDEQKTKVHVDGDDMTVFITNPGFDSSNYDEAIVGWTIDRGDSNGNVTPGPLGDSKKALMETALGYYNGCFESWHCHNWDIWQEIDGLPKGMYELNLQGYVRCEVSGYTRGDDINPDFPSPIYLYMNGATAQFPSVYSECPEDLGYSFTTVESWTTETVNDKLYPNSMGGAAQCFGWGMYKMQAFGLIAKDGDTFRIGVRMNKDQDWWCIFDNFKLTYREPSPDVVKPILEAALEALDLSRPMGSDIYDKASKVNASAEAAIASGDGEAMFNALVAVYDLNEAIESSVSDFADLKKANESLYDAIGNSSASDATKTEANALAGKIAEGLENHTIETSEVEGLIAQINAMITKLAIPAGYENATDANPVDFSSVIVNNQYDEGINGWSGTAASWGSNYANAELYNKTFDYYQEYTGLPAGTYEVRVQGFYRAGTAADDYANLSDESLNNAVLYATTGDEVTRATALTRLGAEAQEGYEMDGYLVVGEFYIVPNTMDTAGDVFLNDLYKNNSVVTKVGEDGYLRIGLKKDVELASDWTLFDNWEMYYYGTDSQKELSPAGISDVNNIPTMKVEFFTLDGRQVSKLQKGITIQKQTLNNGTVIIKKIRK